MGMLQATPDELRKHLKASKLAVPETCCSHRFWRVDRRNFRSIISLVLKMHLSPLHDRSIQLGQQRTAS